MSVTTTANPITLSLQQTLGDYEVHVTGDSQDTRAVASPNSRQSDVVANPPNWPRDYHRIPSRRPVNRNLDMSERPLGSNPGEKLFLNVMFTGVSLNAGVAQLWGATGGKMITKTFKYAIGGEW
ncbi:hypothetical protein ONS95_007264 [Cadophora gregata]|uniref:uncharacterized protein n=1 Tax=Cadophora gregata TaxID=51156 RepID=UPI0026DC985B|nr:uncharacterized protein ONS95_007264 [Cadophora gregata]KAK0100816.1 hypothetical protein ONS95_007264 [Cadophora gregata]KAK0117190.1 hypothetical protein ONS96_013023 [Cadophora gregata f. sp. sojae]